MKNYQKLKKTYLYYMVIILLALVISGLSFNFDPNSVFAQTSITTFHEREGSEVCVDEQDRPIIRLFAATECEKCEKVEKAYIPVVKRYMDQGLILAKLWYKDLGDDLLTAEKESEFWESEEEICYDFDPRCENSLLVAGCVFYRTGAPHGEDYQAEEVELAAVFDELINRTKSKSTDLATSQSTEKNYKNVVILIGLGLAGLITIFALMRVIKKV